MNTILNYTVASQTAKSISENEDIFMGGYSREDEKFEMWMGFFVAIASAIGYILISTNFETNWFIDGVYLFMYLFCLMPIVSMTWDEKKPKVAKTAYTLEAILAPIVLVPFILDMDSIYVHECVGGFGYGVGENIKMTYIYNDYVDYVQLSCIILMVLWCLVDIIYPIYKLHKLNK